MLGEETGEGEMEGGRSCWLVVEVEVCVLIVIEFKSCHTLA